MRCSRFAIATFVISMGVAGTAASRVDATVDKQEPYTESYSYEYSDCGYPIEVVGEFTVEGGGLRTGKNKTESFFFLRERHSFHETHTNTVNDESFVVRSDNSTIHEVKATQVEGSVYEVTQLEVGQPFVVEDSDGNLVARDRGSIRYHFVF